MTQARELHEFQSFYQRWRSPVYTFCFLVCGDKGRAELLTELTFRLYFRGAESEASCSFAHIPVSLLRIAADLARTRGSHRPDTGLCGHTRALLALPFEERSVFILVSILRIQRSVVAVALRLRRRQIAEHWMKAALLLLRFWPRNGERQGNAQWILHPIAGELSQAGRRASTIADRVA